MIKLEQPRIGSAGSLADRVAYLERYIYRLTNELQTALNALERMRKENSDGKKI